MLGNGEDLLLGQAAKRNAIVERDHVTRQTFRVRIEWTCSAKHSPAATINR
jgi:hypothetical protein